MAGGPCLSLALEAHLGAVLDPGGKLEVDRLAVGQGNPLRIEGGGIGERHAQAVLHVGALARRRRRRTAAGGAPAAHSAAVEQPIEEVADVDPLGRAEAFEILRRKAALAARSALGPTAEAAAAHSKGHCRIALGVDLAAVEPGALVLVRQQVVGPGDL